MADVVPEQTAMLTATIAVTATAGIPTATVTATVAHGATAAMADTVADLPDSAVAAVAAVTVAEAEAADADKRQPPATKKRN